MKRCLVVDDSATVRLVLRRILEGLRYTVSEAGTGKAALESCRETMPDLVLLDWNMPEMDGLSFLQVLRSMPAPPRPTVIFCTTVNEVGQIEAALEAGADEYIMKPFDDDVVRAKLSQTGLL